jgi:hypothetical protein
LTRCIVEDITHVLAGVAGRVDDAQAETCCIDHVAVVHAASRISDLLVAAGNDILCAGHSGQLEPARHIIVVQVRLQDVGDALGVVAEQLNHPVDVTLRVNDNSRMIVDDHIAAVAQA